MSQKQSTLAWLLLFALLVALTRYGSLYTEVIDWDESTFILMAQDVLRGNLPYTHLFDNKPPLMFLLLAGMMRLFGPRVAAVRLLGAISLWGTAAAAFGLCRRWAPARAAGIAVTVMITGFDALYFSQYTSVEIVAVAGLMAAAWAVVARGPQLWAAGFAGCCLSLTTLCRPNAATVVIAVGLLYAAGAVWRSLRLHRKAVIAYAIGGLIPLAAMIGLYAVSGHLALFWLGAVTVPLSYAGGQQTLPQIAQAAMQATGDLLRGTPWFLGLMALALAGVLQGLRQLGPQTRNASPSGDNRRDAVLITVIALADLASLFIGGIFQPHYLTLLVPFAALPIAHIIARSRGLALAATLAVAVTACIKLPDLWRPVPTPLREAAAAIAQDNTAGGTVWALRSHLILFYLDQPPLSPVLTHPSNITRPSIIAPLAQAGYIHADELGFVMQSLPRYLVLDAWEGIPAYLTGADRDRFAAFLAARYQPWRRIEPVILYKLH